MHTYQISEFLGGYGVTVFELIVCHNCHVHVCARYHLNSKLCIFQYLRFLYDAHDKLHFFVILVLWIHFSAETKQLIFAKINVLYNIHSRYDLNSVQ